MAKNNNLTDFLTDVADAIRAKKGTTDKINPQDFSSEIASISGGGGGGGGAVAPQAPSGVNFRDYDGTILHAYTKDEFLALSAMPELPTRSGLICQGWNYDFADAQDYVAKYGVLEIGATYITDDGKTRLYITIAAKGRMDVPLYFSQTVANGVTIDWGDGSATETLSGTGNVNTTHHYEDIGDYVISLDVAEGCTLGLGGNSEPYCVMGSTVDAGQVYINMLRKAEIGRGVTSIGIYAFASCYSLASVVIPEGVTSIGNYAFSGCRSLASVVLPQSVTSIEIQAFFSCSSLASVVIPEGVTSIGIQAFYTCRSLASVVLPQSVTSIGSSAFYSCSSLASVVIPEGVTSIGNETFNSCYSLASVVLPQSVTSIGSSAFQYCYPLASVVIPEGVTSIGGNAFHSCYSLASVVLPQSVTSIGSSAFRYCSSLASVVIPEGVTSIESNAFNSCYGMAFYDFCTHESVPKLSNTNAFQNIPSDCKIVVPDTLYDEWIAATNWSTYAANIVKSSEFTE